jgi:pimeloyl-ACP methyl ester carboxylesterase
VLRRYVAAIAPRGALTPLLEYYRSFDRNWELTAGEESRTVEAPALMIAADADPIMPAALSASVATLVPGARREVIRQCGHWTQQERPREVTACLRGFLRDVAGHPHRAR